MYIFNSKNSFSLLVTLGTVFILPFVFWGYGEYFTVSNKFKPVNEQLALWQTRKPTSYKYKLRHGCMSVIEVNAVVSGDTHWFDRNVLPEQISMEDLFTIVSKAGLEAYNVNTTYDDFFSYPSLIEIDWNKNRIDDECFYQITEFTPVES